MSDEQPVVVNPSPLNSQLLSGLRQVLLLTSGLGILSKFLTPAQLDFIQSDVFIGAVSGLVGLITVFWGQINTRLQKAKLVAAATAAPNDKFVVTEEKVVAK